MVILDHYEYHEIYIVVAASDWQCSDVFQNVCFFFSFYWKLTSQLQWFFEKLLNILILTLFQPICSLKRVENSSQISSQLNTFKSRFCKIVATSYVHYQKLHPNDNFRRNLFITFASDVCSLPRKNFFPTQMKYFWCFI
jgi:hypothetical protein